MKGQKVIFFILLGLSVSHFRHFQRDVRSQKCVWGGGSLKVIKKSWNFDLLGMYEPCIYNCFEKNENALKLILGVTKYKECKIYSLIRASYKQWRKVCFESPT